MQLLDHNGTLIGEFTENLTQLSIPEHRAIGETPDSIKFQCQLRNSSHANVKFGQLFTSCGCTEATLSQQVLAIDEVSLLSGRVDLANFQDASKQSVVIPIEGTKQLIQIDISFLCYPSISIGSNIDVVEVDEGRNKAMFFTHYSIREHGQKMNIEELLASMRLVAETSDNLSVQNIVPVSRQTLDLSAKERCLRIEWSASVSFDSDTAADYSSRSGVAELQFFVGNSLVGRRQVPVIARKSTQFSVSRSALVFDKTDQSSTVTLTINEAQDFELSNLSISRPSWIAAERIDNELHGDNGLSRIKYRIGLRRTASKVASKGTLSFTYGGRNVASVFVVRNLKQ